MTSTVKFNGVDIPIKITYKSAWFDLPELGIDILNIFDGEKTIMNILTSEKVMVEVFYYFAKNHCSTIENMLENLTPETMNEFREVFWNEVVNFTNPQMRPALQKTVEMIKKELASPERILKVALSELSEEQELIPPSSPLEKSS